jgi:hypothetical protein
VEFPKIGWKRAGDDSKGRMGIRRLESGHHLFTFCEQKDETYSDNRAGPKSEALAREAAGPEHGK